MLEAKALHCISAASSLPHYFFPTMTLRLFELQSEEVPLSPSLEILENANGYVDLGAAQQTTFPEQKTIF